MAENRWRQTAQWARDYLYSDELIRPREREETEELPPKLEAMRSFAREGYGARELVFVKQARFMRDYEDDYAFSGQPVRYYPVYQSFSDRELRGYFTWRSAWRRGEKRKTALSFAFLYVYELLNLATVDTPEEGYRGLLAFESDYGALEPKILPYLDAWLWDFCVAWQLEPSRLSERETVKKDLALSVLLRLEEHSPTEIGEAAVRLSTYRLDRSRFYKAQRELFDAVLRRVLLAMKDYFEKHRKTSWSEAYLAQRCYGQTPLFSNAVYLPPQQATDLRYELDPVRVYTRTKGRWSYSAYLFDEKKLQLFGGLIHTVDAMLRDSSGYPYPMGTGTGVKWIVSLIQKEIDLELAERKRREKPKLSLDLSSLPQIRQDAAQTREKLITEEEAPEPEPPEPVSSPESFGGLTESETRFLRCLLYAKPLDWLQGEGLLPSVLADSVNEKLFDYFADTVLDVSEEPELVEDYTDELKGMFPA